LGGSDGVGQEGTIRKQISRQYKKKKNVKNVLLHDREGNRRGGERGEGTPVSERQNWEMLPNW